MTLTSDRRSKLRAAALALALVAAAWLTLDDGTPTAPAPGPRARAAAAPIPTPAAPQPRADAEAAAAATTANPQPLPAPAAPGGAASGTASRGEQARSALDTAQVQRRVGDGAGGLNAFASKSWFIAPPPPAPSPPPPPPPEPPPPQAPPLPFKYMGMLQESPERAVWFLLQGERLVVAANGEPIDGLYRIDGADSGVLRITYLPLNQRQTLSIGVPP